MWIHFILSRKKKDGLAVITIPNCFVILFPKNQLLTGVFTGYFLMFSTKFTLIWAIIHMKLWMSNSSWCYININGSKWLVNVKGGWIVVISTVVTMSIKVLAASLNLEAHLLSERKGLMRPLLKSSTLEEVCGERHRKWYSWTRLRSDTKSNKVGEAATSYQQPNWEKRVPFL